MSTVMMQKLSQVSPKTAPVAFSQRKIRALGSLIYGVAGREDWETQAVQLLSKHPGSSQFLQALADLFPLHHGTRDWEGVKFAVFALIGAPDEEIDEGFLYTLVGHMTVARKHKRSVAIRHFRKVWHAEYPPEESAPLVLCPAKKNTHPTQQVAEVAQV